MKTLQREASFEEWDKLWNTMAHEWFKVEVLQDYSGEDNGPSLQAWLARGKEQSIRLMKTEVDSEWVKDCQQLLGRGVKLIRIHVIEQPLSPYLEWEIEHYKNVNVALCGEQVSLVDRSDLGGLNLPPGDFMIFDQKRAVINRYDSKGTVVSADFYNGQDDISELLKFRAQLMQLAKPLE